MNGVEVGRELDAALKPRLLLHKAWWRKLYRQGGRDAWIALMVELHQAIRATTPLLAAAGAVASSLGPSHVDFAVWCKEHAVEEDDHDEWLRDDLVTIGVDPLELEARPPTPAVAEIIGTQFLWATSQQPEALLGYFYVAECHPADPASLERIRVEMGLPESAMRTLQFHAAEDLEHQREVFALLGQYGSSDASRTAMLSSALSFVTGWTKVYQSLAQRFQCGTVRQHQAS